MDVLHDKLPTYSACYKDRQTANHTTDIVHAIGGLGADKHRPNRYPSLQHA